MMVAQRLFLCLLISVLAACGKVDTATPATNTIAIATLMDHPALNEVRAGISIGLSESELQEGRDYRLIERNANGDALLTPTIANELASRNPNIIIAITTPMAQAVHARWRGPFVFAAVTDPVGAGIVPDLSGTENTTGTSDAWPYRAQLQLIRRIQPGARRLAVLFNPGEAASQYGIGEIRRHAPELGFTIVEYPVSSTSEVASAARQALFTNDALFLSSDNTVIAAVGAAFSAAVKAHKPLYVGDSGTVERGGLAAVSVGYHALGIETGRLTAKMLRGETTLPVVVSTGSDIYLNTRAAELMGVTIPPDVIRDAKQVFYEIRQ